MSATIRATPILYTARASMSPNPEVRLRVAWLHSHLLNFFSGGTQYALTFAAFLQRELRCDVRFIVDTAGAEARAYLKQQNVELVELDRASTNSALYWLTLASRL